MASVTLLKREFRKDQNKLFSEIILHKDQNRSESNGSPRRHSAKIGDCRERSKKLIHVVQKTTSQTSPRNTPYHNIPLKSSILFQNHSCLPLCSYCQLVKFETT